MARRRRGKPVPADPFDLHGKVTEELDLHHFSSTQAREATSAFLRNWSGRGRGIVVRIITGRGNRSANGPVLFGLVRRMLEGDCATLVDRWERDDHDGGFLVRLK